ncbi:MAG: SUMF1/EgtB/PvdO family nonheme iron enzyme [Planctomycetia bacterium]
MTFDNDLMMAIAARTLVPFVGAGVSVGVTEHAPRKFPSWTELIGKLAQTLDSKNPKTAKRVRATIEDGDLLDAANVALEKLGKSDFTKCVVDALDVQKTHCDLTLPQAVWGLNPRLVVTTNYDRVLHWASDKDPRLVLNTSHGELRQLFDPVDRPWLWHLHGQMDTADSLILAPSQYKPLYSAKDLRTSALFAAASTLQNVLTRSPVLFVGFSLTDDYVLDAIRQALNAFKGFSAPRWALLKRDDTRARELWDQFQVRIIEYEDHGQPLIQLLQNLASSAGQPAIQRTVSTLNSLPPIPPQCLQFAREQCAHVLPLGIHPEADMSVSLQNVYVPTLVESAQPQSEAAPEDQRLKERPSWQLLMQRLESESVYLAGDAGYGKSTFAKWLCLHVLAPQSQQFLVPGPEEFQEVLPESLKNRLPVLIPFRDLADDLRSHARQTAMGPEQFLNLLCAWARRHAAASGVSADLLTAWLRAGRVLLILDGIDELPTSAVAPDFHWNPKQVVLDSLPLAIREWLPAGNRLVLTSRPYGIDAVQLRNLQSAGLASCSLQPLPEDLQTLLVQRWFSVLPKYSASAIAEAQRMLVAVRSMPRVSELIGSPLQLTAICIVYGQGGELPRDIHDLYLRVVRSSLHARYAHDTVAVDRTRSKLARIAWGMHTGEPFEPNRRNPSAAVSFAEIENILQEYEQTNPQTDKGLQTVITVREELLQRSGLLVPRSLETAAFQHLSFQEFLAAEWWSKQVNDDQLLKQFCNRGLVANWRETLRFLFARKIEDRAQTVVTSLVEQLLRAVVQKTPRVTPELALVCCDAVHILLDRGYLLSPNSEPQLRHLFQLALDQRASIAARAELGLAVGRIGDNRPELDLSNPAAWVTVPADRYPMGDDRKRIFTLQQATEISRFPVTNGQFRRFVDEGGYSDPRYWKAGWETKCEGNWTAPRSFAMPGFSGPTQPVAGVSWFEACAFCEWLSSQGTGYRFELPSEDLWEAAARGPQGHVYPWGDEWHPEKCNNAEHKLEATSVVGVFPEGNSFCGAADITGNVWEWTASVSKGESLSRVVRGGSFDINLPENLRSTNRVSTAPGFRFSRNGFRFSRTK